MLLVAVLITQLNKVVHIALPEEQTLCQPTNGHMVFDLGLGSVIRLSDRQLWLWLH